MAVQTKTIKQKMKSVKNIEKITKAMEMISVSKMRKSVEKHNASDAFADHAFALLENLHLHRKLTHCYLEGRNGSANKTLMLIIASNKGLCGGYNMNVSKQVTNYLKENPDMEVEAITVGKQAAKIAWRNKIKTIASFTDYSEYFSASEVRSIMHTLYGQFDTNESFGKVVVCYTRFISSISYEPKVLQLIPLSIDASKKALKIKGDEGDKDRFAQYAFEPSEQEVLDIIVPRMLMTVVYQTLLDSIASEHSSRVTAMKNASDNAGELLDELRINYNRARQAAITQEIAEIVGGSSAVSS
jgi:F-type H+-transporting ATPase subunit gamma